MELVNELYKDKDQKNLNPGLYAKAVKTVVVLLSPFTPHICEEMWQNLGGEGTLTHHAWPAYDEKALVKDEVEIVVQLNGKVKAKVNIASGLSRDELAEQVKQNAKVQELLEGKNVVKTIAVPNRLVNFVVR
jgi:leucyl-tRNA synthetase